MLKTNIDIVIISQEEVNIFELTVPLEPNIKAANFRKIEKYSHMIFDITSHKVNLTPFEIGSRGYISPENRARLKTIFKFCDKSIAFSNFIKNISTLAILSSYYIFVSRKSQVWDEFTPPIKPIF